MIFADRRCDSCNQRRTCRATGSMFWYCETCWPVWTDVPWEDDAESRPTEVHG